MTMPIYDHVPTFDLYPGPEARLRTLHSGMPITSILDVGSGHGGVFDHAYWCNREGMFRRVCCDIAHCRDAGPLWEHRDGIDVLELSKHFGEQSFDVVQCMECLEHVSDPRKALEQLVKIARKLVVITSADEMHHLGEPQEAMEKINPHCKYLAQPSVKDMEELGFVVRVEAKYRRQLVAWKVMV